MKFRTKVLLIAFAVVGLAAFFVNRVVEPFEAAPHLKSEIFGGTKAMQPFCKPEKVTVQRLRSNNPVGSRDVTVYEKAPERVVSSDASAGIRSLFLQAGSFEWEGFQSRTPRFDVLFTFRSAQRNVQLALSFDSEIFAVTHEDKVVNTEEDFRPMRVKLLKIVRRLFPEDAEI